MDRFEQQLKDDAARIRADVSPELKARIDASVRAATRDGVRAGRRAGAKRPFWWASSLTGLAAAILLIAVLDRDAGNRAEPPTDLPAVAVVPEYVQQLQSDFVLRAKQADLASPLEEELDRLKADLEKARENVERDVRFTF